MRSFDERYRQALGDDNIRAGLLEFQRSWRRSRDGQIEDVERITGCSFGELRHELAVAKDRGRADPSRRLFREVAEAAGVTVVEAAGAAEANAYIAALCRARGVTLAVKGKSMVTEEIDLNDHLAAAGVEAVETDLGEWLLQLEGERPSHLVMPAIHKRRHQVAALLERTLGRAFDPDDIPAMVRSARTELRGRFLAAGVGITGANALVAETGSVMLVTNEGNGRLTASLPPLHVVVAGVDKLVPTLADAMLQVRLLARSATAQPITSYTTFITGPAPGHDLHVVLVDNGRSRMAADLDAQAALRCIRCGACANVCPPYQIVGGHAFGHVYSGPIGLVTTAFHHGTAAAAGPQSLCVSCGACATVCPVEIPLPSQILQVRRRVVEEIGLSPRRRLALRLFASRRLTGAAARTAALLTLPLRRRGFLRLPLPRRHGSWRTPPAVPLRPARSRLPTGRNREASGPEVTLFLQCLTDRLAPQIAVATAELLAAAGASVVVPPGQHCCGLPAYDAGDWDTARKMARATIEVLEDAATVVTPAPSCVVAMVHEYPRLFRHQPEWRERAQRLAGRLHDLVSYLSQPGRLPNGWLSGADATPVTVHRFCQSGAMLGLDDEMQSLVERLCGAQVVSLPENGVCCGFGGSTSLVAPEVAAGILQRKLDCVEETGAPLLITDNPGCVLHLRGGVHAAGREVRVLHVAEFLASRLGGHGPGTAPPR